jgi:predicted Holliday junction resolvase-like endonuclease
MKKMYVLVVLILAGLLVIPALLLSGSRAYAQSGSGMSERERQDLEQKYQEQWDYLERLDKHQESTYERMEEAVKHREDAERRKQQAERQLRELEQK